MFRNSRDFTHLLETTRLDPSEVRARLQRAVEPSYWKRVCPALTVEGRSTRSSRRSVVDQTNRAELVARLRYEGYLQIDEVVPHRSVKAMAHAITSLKQLDWPPAFAFVYDEFWSVWRLPPVAAIIEEALGPSALMRARVWAYYVHPVRGARGWSPHAESHGTPGLSVWVPLTDATLENGCIYVVPKDLIAERVSVGDLFGQETVALSAATDLLHCARALPAAAGSVLMWDFDVIHWGSVVHQPSTPRISISAEFVPATSSSERDLLLPLRSMPAFRDRLRIIAKNIGFFAKNDAWTFKYEDLGRALAAALNPS